MKVFSSNPDPLVKDMKRGSLGTGENSTSDYWAYKQYCKPKLADMLNSLKLDYSYTKAKGNYVYYKDSDNKEIAVLDFVGGFGSNFLGHNNETLKNTIKECFDQDVPMFAQSALRPAAHVLAKKLNQLLPVAANYYCNFTNSGAETVEAALKHAYKVRLDLVRREYERLTRELHDIYHHIEDNQIDIVLPQGVKELSKYRDDLDEYNLAQYEEFQNHPVICAFKGSFHGKTSSALKVTFNKTFREGFEGMSAIRTEFIDLDKPERLREIGDENKIEFLIPELQGKKLVLKRHTMTKVFAMILEVVLGEGGVKPVPDSTLERLGQIHDEINVPFILDEIQTGSGRTGNIFAYLDTPLANIEPEYILLSKAMGGGIVKIGVTMIHEKEYDLDFGFIHTSTFAEDDIACKVSCKTLDVMTENNGYILEQAKEKGHYLRSKLHGLKTKYPRIIKDVRGKGLMIGLEFEDLSSFGPIFRYAGRQGFISLLVTSYVLNYHKIRILAPLTTLFKGNPGKKRESILRIQPPVYILHEEMDRLVGALDETFQIIQHNNEYCLMAHLFDAGITEIDRKAPREIPVYYPDREEQVDFDARIGFIAHITELTHLMDYYLPAFKEYEVDEKQLVRWWNKLSRFLEPDVMHKTYIEHDGFVVEVNLVCVPYFPKHMIKTYTNAQLPFSANPFHKKYLQEMQDKIMDAAIVARDLGDERIPTSLIGLGAYTSIVTENGASLNDYEIPITTGNAYTAALMGQGIVKAAEIHGKDITTCRVAVVGAAGNIGSSLTKLLSFYSGKLFLIGSHKKDSSSRIQQTVHKSLRLILEEIRNQLTASDNPEEVQLQGIAGKIFSEIIKPGMGKSNRGNDDLLEKIITVLTQADDLPEASGEWLNELILRENQDTNPYYEVSGFGVLNTCDVVAIATNSSDAWLIGPEHVQEGAIVCCASVPSNVSETFKNHLDKYFVFDGGYAKLPEKNVIDFVGMPKDGMAYGCLSETLLLAFDGQNSSFAKGPLNISQVMRTIEMADMYGFDLGEFRLGDAIQRAYN